MDTQSSDMGRILYTFGEFTLDVPERRLTRGASPVHLAPKTYDVLVALIRRAGRLNHQARAARGRVARRLRGRRHPHRARGGSPQSVQRDKRIARVHRNRLAVGLPIHRLGRATSGRHDEGAFGAARSRGAAMRVERSLSYHRCAGSGKTAILRELVRLGFLGVSEPARDLLAEQRAIRGNEVFDMDPQLFCHLMLERAIADYQRLEGAGEPTFFDRGIPDMVGYAEIFGLDISGASGCLVALPIQRLATPGRSLADAQHVRPGRRVGYARAAATA